MGADLVHSQPALNRSISLYGTTQLAWHKKCALNVLHTCISTPPPSPCPKETAIAHLPEDEWEVVPFHLECLPKVELQCVQSHSSPKGHS